MFEEILAAKNREVILLKQRASWTVWSGPRPRFSRALTSGPRPTIIAEFKRKSPVAGWLNDVRTPQEAFSAYASGGAAALSVLTDKEFFAGDMKDIFLAARWGLPVLRKDFVVDPIQVDETGATPASALLVVVRLVPQRERLIPIISRARDLGLEVLFEVFDERDLKVARQAGARIIQVNNRDLSDMKVDKGRCQRLIRLREPGEVWIAASGFTGPDDVREAREAGYEAVLIGSYLMKHPDPTEALRSLRKQEANP